MRTAHLFAGGGGGLLADLILGHESVLAVEHNPYACQILRERAADGWFPGLHVYEGDIRLFDPSDWQGRVDCIHAGFPCTDISCAGRGEGIEGEASGLWKEVVRVAKILRPEWIFLENSPIITSRGLDVVLRDLAGLGFDAEWCVLPASAVGAPHIRARWWCLAKRTDADQERRAGWPGLQREGGRPELADACGDVANAQRHGLQGREPAPRQAADVRRRSAEPCGEDMPNAVSERLERQQQGGPAPAATDRPGPGNNPGWWSFEPNVGRVVNGLAARSHQLETLGNGQVPLQAAAAWVMLMNHFN